MKTRSLISLTGLALSTFITFCVTPLSTVRAQGTAFTYQGRLNVSGAPANGAYDLVFTVYDLPTGSGAFANQTNAATPVSNGLFTVTLDFGPGIFTGPERWLEIAARTNGGGAFANLAPRQKITATPYAIAAGNVTGSVLASQLSGSIAPANIGAGTITSAMLAAGSVTTSNLADGAVNLAKLNTVSTWTSSPIFTNPTPAISDTFGLVMAAVGTDKVLISTIWDSPGISGAGAAYLFSTNGSLLMTFTNPAPVQEDLFGIAMAAVGPDKVLIAAYHKDIGATNAGAAYLFSTNGSLLTTFTNPTPELGDEFGRTVTEVGANRVLIAAAFDDTGATNAGAAYLFNLNGTLLVTFTNPAPATDDWFGYHVISVGADKVLIAAPLDSSFGPNAGAAYLYSTNGALLTTVTNPSPGQVVFGAGLASVGSDKFIVAALLDATNGVAYLFNTNGTRLATFGPALGLNFSLAWVRPDKVAINVPTGPGGASFVYIFNTNGTQLATLSNPSQLNNDLFAYTLAAVGDRVVVGAPQNNTGALESGIAYLFGANGAAYVPGLISQGVLDGSITAASLGNIAIDSSKIADGTIGTVDLANGSVTDAKIADVDGSKLTGIVQDARLSGNVAFLYANQTFTGQNTLNNPANVFAGDGNGLTSLNSSQLASGTVPDARLSANVPRLNANQTFTGQNTLDHPANSFSGNGGGLTNVNASTLGGINSNGFWKTTGNAGTTPGANFFGTTDNQPLAIRVNNTVALRIDPAFGGTPNIVGGLASFLPTVIGNGVRGAVVAGGNAPAGPVSGLGGGDFHAVYDSDGTVGGGFGNKVGSNNGNPDDAPFTTVAGGVFNGAAGYAATVAGGDGNLAGGVRSVVGGGAGNQAIGTDSAVVGGLGNRAEGHHASIGGGQNNIATNAHSAVAGGGWNTAGGISSFIGGGGGDTFGGPWPNTASGNWSAILGGWNNTASGYSAVVGGGGGNTASGQYAVVPGGDGNQATANNTFAAGRLAQAIHAGSFVWADSSGGVFSSSGVDQFNVRAAGGVNVVGNILASGTITPNSDRNAKTDITPADPSAILERVAALPIHQWRFKIETENVKHVGPMAQDFHAAFGLGAVPTAIATVDADGVALAAIQGLNARLDGTRSELKQRDEEIAELKARLEKLERLIGETGNAAK